ncbi:MAG TPA: EAL domain-containing protein [Desulfovibrio sp.]|jgi:Amt family ammonium transporter|uniref:bifunctional diguanylate cyclase/phosphodiesterase n=1 Tax=Desulfovibrio TaxID=872 RepID=UPI00040BE3C2|nr:MULTISPECIES: bifunctional diguanylate cyclase/phosphodiesterase [Desulfovibrio]MDY0306141.1 EAL domain-containing protein [Desulfovibrionaceae bacterium]HMM37985.1 EAL domain-containing protein [Desulfovibrio sp.]
MFPTTRTESLDSEIPATAFGLLLDGAPDPAALIGPDARVERANAAFAQAFGPLAAEPGGDPALLPAGLSDRLVLERLLRDTTRTPRRQRSHLKQARGVPAPFEVTTAPLSGGRLLLLARDLSSVAALERSERRYRNVFDNAVEGIFVTTPDGRYIDANPALARMYGFDSPTDLKAHFDDIASQLYVEPGRRDEYLALMAEFGEVLAFESEIYRKDGKTIWISENSRAVLGPEGRPECYEGTVMDITERKLAQEALETQRAYFHQLFESSPQAIVLIGVDGRIVNANTGFEALFGHEAREVRGKLNREVVVPTERIHEAESFNRTVLAGQPIEAETMRRHRLGRLIPVSVIGYPVRVAGRIAGVFYIYTDITQRKEFEEQLAHQAFHDALTGLPNRLLFSERVERAVERAARREDYRFAVLMIDLDRFKTVNDSLGHQAGDKLLMAAARRLESCVRSSDSVARLGGDEFAMLLEEYEHPHDVTRVARRIHEAMERPFIIDGTGVVCGASIGIVLRAKSYRSSEDILRDADIAMYRAKSQGTAQYKVFNRKMHEQATEFMQLEQELRQALDRGELSVHYQPIVAVGDQRLKGFEALVRWEHPRRGRISPDRFIPVAEETGLIAPLGQWVLLQACAQMRQWRDRHPEAEGLSMSVNISSRQIMRKDFLDGVREALDRTGLPPAALKLELTESSLLKDSKSCLETLHALRDLGVRLVVDDFGTGYSSLNYLQRLPIDTLKIDRSFISGEANPEIVRTIIALARNLNLNVVAEGVEREDQLERLACENCDEAQGFLFSKPVDGFNAGRLIARLLGDGGPCREEG